MTIRERLRLQNVPVAPSRVLLGVAAVLLLAGSFFLPNIVAGVTDAATLDKLILTDTQGYSFDSVPSLDIVDRIELVANRNIEKIPLKTGRALDMSAASTKALFEIERCFRGGPLDFNFRRCQIAEGGAVFVINTAEPSVNIIVWEFTIDDPAENTMTISLDDETGLIIKVIYRRSALADMEETQVTSGQPGRDELYAVASKLTEMMADYYGMPIALADYKLSDDIAYYKAELTGDRVIPMYGIVRAHVFTMNEQA